MIQLAREINMSHVFAVSCNGNEQTITTIIIIIIIIIINIFNLQVANSPSRLRFEANLSRESSECTEHLQGQMSQINTGKTVYVGNA